MTIIHHPRAGSTFHHWIADHNTLWTNPTTEEAVVRAVRYYTLLGSVRYTPLPYIWLAIAVVAASTMAWRAIRGLTSSKGERFNGGYLFDAGCCRESLADGLYNSDLI